MAETDTFLKKFLRPRRLMIAAAAVLAILVLFFGVQLFLEKSKVVPEDMLKSSIAKTTTAKSYRFHSKSTIYLDGKETVFSDLNGEKSDESCFHVTGTMLNTDIDVYQINTTTYRRDHITKKWIVIENNSILKESLLMAELNPLSNFYFKELVSSSYLGKEKVDHRTAYKIQCVPNIKSKWLDSYFKDLKYIIWIGKKDNLIKKAVITAKSKEKATGSLKVEVLLFDYGEKTEIKAPIQ